jgi:hypothetical protein
MKATDGSGCVKRILVSPAATVIGTVFTEGIEKMEAPKALVGSGLAARRASAL